MKKKGDVAYKYPRENYTPPPAEVAPVAEGIRLCLHELRASAVLMQVQSNDISDGRRCSAQEGGWGGMSSVKKVSKKNDGHVAVGGGNGDVKPAAAWDTMKTSLAPVVCRLPHLEGKSAEEIPGKKDVNPYSHASIMTFFEGRTHPPMFVPPIQRKEGS